MPTNCVFSLFDKVCIMTHPRGPRLTHGCQYTTAPLTVTKQQCALPPLHPTPCLPSHPIVFTRNLETILLRAFSFQNKVFN